ncbi:MAG TPA: hypothetical protein VGN53_07300 [Klebsiella sp.]|jgi:hypothetical protein
MTTTQRALHHGGWFALLGPCVGLVVAIVSIIAIAFQYYESPGVFLGHIVTILPILLIMTWLTGAIPALLTGIAVAYLPTVIYTSRYWRTLASAVIGLVISVTAVVVNVLIFTDQNLMYFILREEVCWIVAASGLLAGMVMGWLISSLPGQRAGESD